MDSDTTCTNCGTAVNGRYRPSCGQDARPIPTQLLALLRLFAQHATGVEGRVVQSVMSLLLRPGRLTRAYVEGQRARYVTPVQVYLLCTAGFFLLHAYTPFVRLDPETGAVESRLSALSVGIALPASMLSRLSANGISLASFAPRFDAAVRAYLPALLMAVLFWREAVVSIVVFAAFLATWLWSTTVIAAGLASWSST